MGIHTYNNVVQIGKQPAHIRIQLRFFCNGGRAQSAANSTEAVDVSSSSSSKSSFSSHNSKPAAAVGDVVAVEGFVSAFALTDKPPRWSPNACHYGPLNIRHLVNISIHSR